MKSIKVAKTMMRNESERVEGAVKRACIPCGILIYLKNLSKIRTVSTRKMMSFARIGRSLKKLRWRSDIVLTCKSLVESW